MNEPIVHDGEVYPDEMSFVAATHPNIPEDIKRIYVSPKPKEEEPKPDYDYDSWQKANPGVQMAPGQHYPDTYKLPNHITFSDESMYHGGDNQGGHWGQDEQGKDTFTPGPTNLQNYPLSQIKEYFQRVEPDVKLIVPDTAAGMASQASEKAAGALKAAQGTPATVDSDTGIDGPVRHQIPWLRQAMPNLDSNITQGDYDRTEDIGLSFSGGGLTFKGVRSPTFDRGKLYEAQNMQGAGATADEIWQKTGSFQGADARWRQEISDTGASLKEGPESPIVLVSPEKPVDKYSWHTLAPEYSGFFPKDLKLPDVLDHPELFKSYPHLKDVKVASTPPFSFGMAGAYDVEENILYLGAQKKEEMLSTVLHEVQHAIQNREGFSMGGNTKQFLPEGFDEGNKLFQSAVEKTEKAMEDAGISRDQVKQAIYARKLEMTNDTHISPKSPRGSYTSALPALEEAKNKGFLSQIDTMVEGQIYMNSSEKKAVDSYLRVMGEVEAYNVEKRAKLSELERKLQSPQSTEKVPRDQQIESKLQSKGLSAKEDEITQFRRAANDNKTFVERFKEDLPQYTTTQEDLDRIKDLIKQREEDLKK